MRVTIMLAVLCGALLTVTSRAESPGTKFFVQLIQGTDPQTIPAKHARPAGPALCRKFNSVFREKSYWELSRREVIAHPNKPVKVSLNEKRDISIEIADNRRIVTIFYDGHPVIRRTDPRSEAMTLIGDHRGSNGVWFIVVRRDKPGN